MHANDDINTNYPLKKKVIIVVHTSFKYLYDISILFLQFTIPSKYLTIIIFYMKCV